MFGSNITGRLLNARRVRIGRHWHIRGNIYEDVRGKFPDGKEVTTSRIMCEDGSIICTYYSIYEIESWAATRGPEES